MNGLIVGLMDGCIQWAYIVIGSMGVWFDFTILSYSKNIQIYCR